MFLIYFQEYMNASGWEWVTHSKHRSVGYEINNDRDGEKAGVQYFDEYGAMQCVCSNR